MLLLIYVGSEEKSSDSLNQSVEKSVINNYFFGVGNFCAVSIAHNLSVFIESPDGNINRCGGADYVI